MSTSKEIAKGRQENEAINRQSIVVADPFLTSWVDRIGSQLAQRRLRRDINYTFTVIDDQSINAFAIKGGFVHVNAGLLNFVSSDDELAATLGHEMGHVELHHVTKADNTNTVIGILESIVSLISIPTAILGGIAGELASQKYSRIDELQADKYGLSLMSASGYDPQAAVSVMRKLNAMDAGPGGRADKAFLDHPVPRDRVAHLLGYQPLDRPSAAALMGRGEHDASEGRYSYAQAALLSASSAGHAPPPASEVRFLNYALRESGPLASPHSRSFAPAIGASDPRRRIASSALIAAERQRVKAQQTLKSAAPAGETELSDLEHRLSSSQAIAAEAQTAAGSVVRSGGSGQDSPRDLAATLNRNLNDIANLTDDVFASAPGIVDAERQVLSDMLTPLADDVALTPKYTALLAYYPSMTANIDSATAGLIDAVAKGRAALADVATALNGLDAGVSLELNHPAAQSGSSETRHGDRMRAAMIRFASDVGAAQILARAASSQMYSSQAVTLSAQLSMLDLYSSPERFAAYGDAIAYRFPGVQPLSYAHAAEIGMPPGELGCAAWVAFESRRPLLEVATAMRRTGQTCATAPDHYGFSAESMEIAEGLLFEDYDETPSLPQQ